MRWRRSCKRLMILLMFVCMTVKLHLEFRLLDTTKANSFSPWWTNETLGHLRGFPKTKSLPRGNATVKEGSLKHILLVGGKLGRAVESEKSQTDASEGIKDSEARDVAGPRKNETNKSVGSSSDAETTKSNGTLSAKETKKNSTEKVILPSLKPQKERENDLHLPHPPLSHIHSNRKLTNENADAKKDAGLEGGAKTKTTPDEKHGENILHPQVAKPKEDTKPKPEVDPKPPPKSLPRPLPRQALHPGPKKKTPSRRGVSHDVDPQEMSLSPEEIEKIKKKLEQLNEEQTIYNEETFGPILRNTTILLVQVHNRLENLRYLVESMRNTRGINESLVIFSHDYWYPAMNDFVTNITEFRVMQMFFPFSIQLHPHKFPGRDPRDCSWNVNRLHGLTCLNREWPDIYGHYREASFTQIKHHWWWKIHRVFHDLRATKVNYTGHVIFLEEDHYILPDLLYVLSVLQKQRSSHCSTCQVLALGNYNKMSPSVYKNFVERGDWWVTKHNLGFALDMAAWKSLASCKNQFCLFDDYNWDWTLNNLIQTCFKPRMSMLSVKFSRVIHVGSCGTHVKKRTCDVQKEVQAAKTRINLGKEWLFPKHLAYQNVYRGSGRVKKGNGGWGDFRDRQLCRAIWNGTASEETLKRLEMNQFG